MDLYLARQRRIARAKPSDQLFNAGVDVGTIESGDTFLDESGHVVQRLRRVDCAMVAGEMPAALDDARDLIPVADRDAHERRATGRSWAAASRWSRCARNGACPGA
jgi:hypothetical protein